MTDRRRRASARSQRRERRGGGVRQLAWRAVTNPYPPVAPLAEDQVEAVHDASMRILEDIGMDFLHPEALDILSAGGADVTPGTHRVRLDRNMVAATIASAPASFRLHARNPAHDIIVGEDQVAFASIGSPPYASDLDRGRRPGNFEDYLNLVRLGQACNIVHLFGGYPVEAIDLPPSTRHLDCLAAFVTLSDKVFHAYSLGRERIRDGIEIARIGRGISTRQMRAEPSLYTVVNTSSPLRLDSPMIEGVIEMARMNQPVVATPFTLAGAMAPAALAGALAQQNAEALATIVLVQLVSPGAPVA
ncbi:MAG: trimethylamine methyltransferase family protein, partial [Acidimicrobiia bacterium]